jgi:hypothetical protein
MLEKRTTKTQSLAVESGDVAPVSGLYRVEHSDCVELVWVRSGHRLPLCPACGSEAVFILQENLRHISEDPDFQ